MTSKILQVLTLIGFGCTTLISATVIITASYTGQDGESFVLGSNATFTCRISPYDASLSWKVDSIEVAECGFVSCGTNNSNPVRYSFIPDISTGIFIFTISTVTNEDNDNVIECTDGSITDSVTLMVVTGSTKLTYDTVPQSNVTESNNHTSQNTGMPTVTSTLQHFSVSTTEQLEPKLRKGLIIVVGTIVFCLFVAICPITVYALCFCRRLSKFKRINKYKMKTEKKIRQGSIRRNRIVSV